jgi:hypothetical protein
MFKALISSIIMAVVVLAVQQVRYSIILFPVYVFIGAAVYIGCIRILKVFNESDIQLLGPIVGKRITAILAKVLGYKK